MSQSNLAHNLEAKQRTKDVLIDESVTFDVLLLPDYIMKGLEKSGFQKPSPIQLKAIPLGRCGFDLIIKSKSGTGKTLVFSIVALLGVNATRPTLQALILVPTREIAVQIEGVLKILGSVIPDLKVESFIGGLPLEDDIKKAKGCHIAVGAPGRVKHLISEGHLPTEFIRLFVLDEADKLMEKSFQGDINEIFNVLSERKQIIASSATYPQQLNTFLSNYMLSPTHVSADSETPILLGLVQFVSVIKSTSNVAQAMKLKNETLVGLLSKVTFVQCLIFCNYQTRAESICNMLKQRGFHSTFISAAQPQIKRLEAVNDLKEFKSRIMLSTDLASRGIDAANVDLVINYDIPQTPETYLHRMGRAGRYGSSGMCINLVGEGTELEQLQRILGAIGSSKLSIAKLPDCNSLAAGNIDPSSLEQVFGMESSSEWFENIKSKVMSMKPKEQNTKKRSKDDKNNDKNDDVVDRELNKQQNKDCIMNLINNSEKNATSREEITNVNNEVMSGSSGSSDNTKVEVKTVMIGFSDDSKKRKRCEKLSLSTNTELHKEKRKADHRSNILCKNKALLAVTKLLCHPDSQVDQETVNSVADYLSLLKSNEFPEDSRSEPVKEIFPESFRPITNCIKSDDTCVDGSHLANGADDFMEGIFKVGYESTIDEDKAHWMNCLPDDEVNRFHIFTVSESAKEPSQWTEESTPVDDEDYNDDCVMEEYSNACDVSHVRPEQDAQPHNSVVPPTSQMEYFARCFEERSENLWQHGLTFDTVDKFDAFYLQWQEGLKSVRDYVQQNIYVQEMSQYQRSRFNT